MNKRKRKKRINRIISIVSFVGFIASTLVLLYPVISDRWNRYRDLQLITNYNETISNTDPELYENELEKAADYNEILYSQGRNIVTDAEYDPDAYYESLLNIMGNGVMCYIEIPKIDVTEPVYHYSTEVSLGEGVGHIHGSSLPVGGKNTHSVLTGHRGLPNQKFFSDLDKIEIGDCFYIHIYGHTLAYKVYDIDVILPTDVSGLMIEEGKDLATLVTCEPYGVNTHRLLVKGERIEFDENNVDEQGLVTTENHKTVIDPAVWVFIGFMVFIFIIVIFVFVQKALSFKKDKNNEERGSG